VNFGKLLAANRSEIAIRVFRAAHELGIRTVAMYSHEDRYALHRFKADEAYEIGNPGEPIQAYLDIESVIDLARRNSIDAIHPGYGFLSENAEFAEACARAGIIFIGPPAGVLRQLGDKLSAREIAIQAGVPVLGGSDLPVSNAQHGRQLAEQIGYPVMLKASHGGGGRGMRVVEHAEQLAGAFDQARREAETAFGNPSIFIEKFIVKARHIEVQLLGDRHGNLVHLFERDCSVQRRHQKVVEIAPAPNLAASLRTSLCDAAVAVGRQVDYENAGTVEFLVDAETNEFYFIEVNPRIQVEHTVTEQVTGIDVVKSQILIAQGTPLDAPDLGLDAQAAVECHGYAIQCRVTTEDPGNDFMPDYGRIAHYRSASGMGIRLDAGTAFSGAVVFPFYDSLLVKVTAWARRFNDAARRGERCLQEFRVRGVKTNIPFLIKLVMHPQFTAGDCTTQFIDRTPDLFHFAPRRDRATKLLSFLADTIVNGNPLVKDRSVSGRRTLVPVPEISAPLDPEQRVGTMTQGELPSRREGFRQQLRTMGPERFIQSIRNERQLLITDTTFRDAHQSLLATRFRTYDMLQAAEAYSRFCPELFSIEMWGGATFDVALRFLKECPWQRLVAMRERIPNILFQMLLRASNAVGYTNYPDNVVRTFVGEAVDAGIDLFRVFDALNWVPNMRVAIEAVVESGALCEAAICYTGDILDPKRDKYDLDYYVRMAKELEQLGAHILAIKDMAGLCKPYAARKLVRALREEIGIPIHFHTHDTAGVQTAAILEAAEEDLDIADAAMAPMSGGTSQPNLNTLVEALRFTDRQSDLDPDRLDALAQYWRLVREFYTPFESPVLPASSDIYEHQMPGGQYTNLFQQARALGLADRWTEICQVYADVNRLFGDIVKVTPTSKAVGDMALFLIANEMSVDQLMQSERDLSFPDSVIDLLAGRMGQPPGGFPPKVVERVLGQSRPLEGRPGEQLPDANLDQANETIREMGVHNPHRRDVISYLLYPRVFTEFLDHQRLYADVSIFPTPIFFYGLKPQEEVAVDIEPGKTLIIKFIAIGQPHDDGTRTVFFELNGQPRDVTIIDRSLEASVVGRIKADRTNDSHVAADMPGMVCDIAVSAGESVKKGQKLLLIEAMKMQTTVLAERDGAVGRLLVESGTQVDSGDLMLTIES